MSWGAAELSCHFLLACPVLAQRRTQRQEKLSIRYNEMIKCQTLPSRGEQVRLVSIVALQLLEPRHNLRLETPPIKDGYL